MWFVALHIFCKIILESSQNVSETTPDFNVVLQENPTVSKESYSHMIDYHMFTDDHAPFDIRQCFTQERMHHFRIQIEGRH